jgi:hypothetical protein
MQTRPCLRTYLPTKASRNAWVGSQHSAMLFAIDIFMVIALALCYHGGEKVRQYLRSFLAILVAQSSQILACNEDHTHVFKLCLDGSVHANIKCSPRLMGLPGSCYSTRLSTSCCRCLCTTGWMSGLNWFAKGSCVHVHCPFGFYDFFGPADGVLHLHRQNTLFP